MKNIKSFISIILLLCLFISGCSSDKNPTNTYDYSNAIGNLPEAAISPSETYIIECLKQSKLVLDIEAVTESNDPNGKLNETGGYSSCVFFSSTLIDQSVFSEKSVVEKGTSCGGCIEVYSEEADATTRNDYLAKFDGGLLDSGSHIVIGTIVIRTSEKLSKEQQTELTQDLISIITSDEQPSIPNDQVTNDTSSESESENAPSISEPATTPTTESQHTHNFSNATCTAPKTCSCGATEGNANGHTWKAATCKNPKTCTSCNVTEGSVADHSWKNATYTSPKTCTVCGETEGNPIDVPGQENYHGHVYTGGDSSTKYHYESDCAGKYSHEITWNDVERQGLDPCGTCVFK